jgi:hypothetical protein
MIIDLCVVVRCDYVLDLVSEMRTIVAELYSDAVQHAFYCTAIQLRSFPIVHLHKNVDVYLTTSV